MSNVPRKVLLLHVYEKAELEVGKNLSSLAGKVTFWSNIVPLSIGDPSLEFLEFGTFRES
jgi:hypothetical protein